MSTNINISSSLPSGQASGASSGGGSASKIAALQAQLVKVQKALKDVAASDSDAKTKETLTTAYQNQISTIQAQIQALQNQDIAKAQAKQAAKAQETEQATPDKTEDGATTQKASSGTTGGIIDTFA